MANLDRSRSGRNFLPDGVRLFLFNRAVEFAGSLLIFLGLGTLLALLSWSSLDPSLNAAGDGLTSNIMGPPGAIVADLGYQILGFASLVLPLILIGWGWRIISRQGLPHWKRHILLIAPTLIAASATASALPVPESWPLSAGIGGLLGDGIILPIHDLISGALVEFPRFLWALPFAAATLLLFVLSAGLATAEWRYLWAWIAYGLRMVAWVAEQTFHKVITAFTALVARVRRRPQNPKPAQRKATQADPAPAASADDEADISEFSAGDEESKPAPRTPRMPARKKVTRSKTGPLPSKRAKAEAEPQLDLDSGPGKFTLPPLNLLEENDGRSNSNRLSDDALEQNARLLEQVLEDFGVRGEIVEVRPGPVVTLYELRIASGIRSNRVISLADDIARSMSAVSARIASIPGRDTLGIELPNAKRETVFLRDLLSTREFDDGTGKLNLALGKDIGGTSVVADLARMPHLLIAGTTGSGKSVAINTMLLSLLYRLKPSECRLVMIDPKMLELSVYNDIPHLLTPVVTDPKKAVVALKWTVKEMEERYRKMSQMGVRNINGYNQRMKEAMDRGEALSRTVQTGFDEDGQPIFEEQMIDMEVLPFIVVVVDEMADLMMVAGKDVEGSIQRLAQMARAAGIHLIMATQRPSVDVITGTIKANFPTRISFQVTSKIDSRTILGEQGAEQLLGMGDMLYMAGGGRVSRVHGPFVSDEEVEEIVAFLKRQGTPEYLEAVTEDTDGDITSELMGGIDGAPGGGDNLFDQAVQIVARDRKASTSYIQRKLKIGYNRAARLVEEMEEQGMISPPNHVGKREVLLPDHGEEQPF